MSSRCKIQFLKDHLLTHTDEVQCYVNTLIHHFGEAFLREVHEERDFGQKKCHPDRRFEAEFSQDTNAHTNCSSELLQSFKLLPLPNLLEKMRANLSFTQGKGRK